MSVSEPSNEPPGNGYDNNGLSSGDIAEDFECLAARWLGKCEVGHGSLMMAPGRFTSNNELSSLSKAAGLDLVRLDADAAAHSVEIHRLLARNNLQAETIGLTGTSACIFGPFLSPGRHDFAPLQEAVAEARQKDAIK